MMHSNRILSLLFIASSSLVLFSLVVRIEAGLFDFIKKSHPLKNDFDLLNTQLVDALGNDNDSPTDNLIIALDWLKVVDGEQEPEPGLNVKRMASKDALLLFTSLLSLMDPERPLCDLVGMKILQENEQACDADLMRPKSEIGHLRRVEDIVHQVAQEHATYCRYEHPKRFAMALNRADQKIVNEISDTLDAAIETSKLPVLRPDNRELDPRYVLKQKATAITLKDKDEIKAVLEHLRSTLDTSESKYLSKVPDPKHRNKWIVMDKKVEEVLERNLFSQCQYVLDSFYPSIAPASLHQQLFENDFKYKAVDDDMANLMLWIQYYGLCQTLNDELRQPFLKTVIKMIKDDK